MASEVEQLDILSAKCNDLKAEIAKVIVGQEEVINQLLITIFSRGHCLLVGVPGLAKTLLVNTIAKTLGLSFNRIQFTPDLMPSDIIGSEILNRDRVFEFIKGPVFSNIVLADEINRTPPKTQAALLEAMQEHSATVNGKIYRLPEPFFVLATQNPIEQEGTYPLPEAQLDRFMFMLWLDYPSFEEEVQVLKQTTTGKQVEVRQILSLEDIQTMQRLVQSIPVSDNVYEYAVRLVTKTRQNEKASPLAKQYLSWGAGPRASQYLIIGAKCHAALRGKYSPDIEDVDAVAVSVLRHRIVLNYAAQAEGYTAETIIKDLINEQL
ncbi:MAG: MoxR family ATPase [Bacteroidales bacterium]|nr:MoxR family ATPase [Bacteroidales bacterium]MBQ2304117.1 MoxR family ATPase [Bacteroidales bacterium]MBQ2386248.1 MoxR family ATPase [Bacteroidales bacterium]MEE0895354.1 MoxR family ATPase [Bacteroidales bacterium]MEE0910327.1 MoxR family ATPase [Bacteroidales bacterium]